MGAVFRKGNHMGRRGVFYTGPSLSYIKYEGGCVALFSTHKGKSTPKKFKPPGMNKEKDHVVPRRQQVACIRHLAWGIFKRQCYYVRCMCDTFSGAPRFLIFFCVRADSFFSIHTWIEPPPGWCTKSVSVPYPCMRWEFIVKRFFFCYVPPILFIPVRAVNLGSGDAGALGNISLLGVWKMFLICVRDAVLLWMRVWENGPFDMAHNSWRKFGVVNRFLTGSDALSLFATSFFATRIW